MRRGVEAPFQLLVSVFTMILVVAIANYVLQQGVRSRCSDQWTRDLGNLSTTILSIARADPPAKDVIDMKLSCGGSKLHQLSIFKTSGAWCARLCGVSGSCYLLRHRAYNSATPSDDSLMYSQAVCLKGFTDWDFYLISNGIFCPSDYTPLFSSVGSTEMNASLNAYPKILVSVQRNEDSVSVCWRR